MERLFPELDRDRVAWCEGLPWFLVGNRWVKGIVLPHPWRRGHVRVHLRRWERLSAEGQGLLVHEAVHAWQYQRSRRWWALGLWHPFLLRYLAAWMRTGYRAHPLEAPAYAFEARFEEEAFEHPDPDAEEDPERLPWFAPPDLHCPDPWPAGGEAFWRLALAAGILLVAAPLYALVEALGRLAVRPKGREWT